MAASSSSILRVAPQAFSLMWQGVGVRFGASGAPAKMAQMRALCLGAFFGCTRGTTGGRTLNAAWKRHSYESTVSPRKPVRALGASQHTPGLPANQCDCVSREAIPQRRMIVLLVQAFRARCPTQLRLRVQRRRRRGVAAGRLAAGSACLNWVARALLRRGRGHVAPSSSCRKAFHSLRLGRLCVRRS